MKKWKYPLAAVVLIMTFFLGALFGAKDEPPQRSAGKDFPAGEKAAGNEAVLKDRIEAPQDGMAGMEETMGKYAESMHKAMADRLGMSWDQIRNELAGGKTIADLATEKGIKPEKLIDELVQLSKTDFEQLVKNGEMTKDQMDSMMEMMEAMIKSIVEGNSSEMMEGLGV